jgi:hypothetical protein
MVPYVKVVADTRKLEKGEFLRRHLADRKFQVEGFREDYGGG